MKANQDKRHFLFSLSTKFSQAACMLGNSGSQKLSVTTDRRLNFIECVTNLCDKAGRKIQAPHKNFPLCAPNTKITFSDCLFYVSIGLLSFS